MKMLSKWIMLVGLLSLILTGCGTTKVTDNNTNGSNVSQNEEQGKQIEDEQSTDTEQTTDETSQGDETAVRAESQDIEYTLNSETKKEVASLQESDNQHYSMYVLPDFELTPEEPNKDVVFLSENGHVFMRIELLPNDVDWNFLTENTKAQLEAVNSTVQNLEAPDDDFYKNAVVMETSSNNDVVTAYLIKNDNQPLKLTIFSQKDLDYRDAFLKMGKTIVKTSNN